MAGHDAHLPQTLIRLHQNLADFVLLREIGRLQHFKDQRKGICELFLQHTAPHRKQRRADIRFILSGGNVKTGFQSADRMLEHLLQFQCRVLCRCQLPEQTAAMRQGSQRFNRAVRQRKIQRQMHDSAARSRMIQHGYTLNLFFNCLDP